MTALPVGPQHTGQTAGPAFEIVRPAFFVLPHRDAAWKILRERFETLADVSLDSIRQVGSKHETNKCLLFSKAARTSPGQSRN